MEKLQLLVPKLTGNEKGPAFIGSPLPVNTMVCAPAAKVPLAEKVTPFIAVVLIENVPGVVTFTGIETVFVPVKAIPCV
jgi:hypothetical protein